MEKPHLFLSFLLIAAMQNAFAQETTRVSFSPDGYRHAAVTVSRQVLTMRWKPSTEEGAATIAFETEKPVAIKVEDYNFDGYQDFSISSLDEGIGTYRIYRIFTYSASRHEFVEIRPACGDDFINVRLTKKSRTLTNSYYSDNVMKTCTQKYLARKIYSTMPRTPVRTAHRSGEGRRGFLSHHSMTLISLSSSV